MLVVSISIVIEEGILRILFVDKKEGSLIWRPSFLKIYFEHANKKMP